MSGILSTVYNSIVKRNTIFLTTIFAGAFATNIAFDVTANKIWDQVNKGRQWKDIKHKYMEAAEEDDDE
ncbi:Putative cytochrome b-c1 complex subunit 9 [Septoria linicola]|uniref:Complex III subunit 9 n=1 Tax=Septoria linicola TaxID=215465 RepID=A0A9Q9AUD7_9PEZI|nr:putative cytochrome b-c1 complex subunit 9 [Septoria linicola]USW56017.1 Putative cytochrome b-c1 complex subunit 9 [Septoria linicola]